MVVDQFHHRLTRVEQKLAKKNNAPTVPKYDLQIIPTYPESYSPSTTIQLYGNGGLSYIAVVFATIDIDGVTQVSNSDLFFNNLFAMPSQIGTPGPANTTRMNNGAWHHIVIQADRTGTDTWSASLTVDGVLASSASGMAYWQTFPRVEHIDFHNNGFYVDDLSVVTDVVSMSHDFEDSTFGSFVQGDWTIENDILGHSRVAFGSNAGTAVMESVVGSFGAGTGATHVTIEFDAIFPPFT